MLANNQRGNILVDCMLAIMILMTAFAGVGGIAGMFDQNMKANSINDNQSIAINLAQERLEWLKTTPPGFSDITTSTYVTPAAWTETARTVGAVTFTRTTEGQLFQQTVAAGTVELYDVRVTVSWREPGATQDDSVVLTGFYNK